MSEVFFFVSGKIILIKSYLETNEPYKAADMVLEIADSTESFLKVSFDLRNTDTIRARGLIEWVFCV